MWKISLCQPLEYSKLKYLTLFNTFIFDIQQLLDKSKGKFELIW